MHCLHEEMTMLLNQLLLNQRKEINECKANRNLLTLNVSDEAMQMKLENINYGSKAKKLHKKLPEGKRKDTLTEINDSYINMAADLQKFLPLDVSLLM